MNEHTVPTLRATALSKTYRTRRAPGAPASTLHAVEGVSIELLAGRITAVVGESGSGKSTMARLLAGVERPSSGRIELEGEAVRRIPPKAVQMVFQDPFASLNPVHGVGHHVARPLALHRPELSRAARRSTLLELLERVQLTPAAEIAERKPHQLSGGQRQRVSIARALAAAPTVILADEPVSMLDVSIRLGVLNLLADLTRTEGVALLYITHDIATARYFADTILVMYGGRIVEEGPAETVTQRPAHPYTRLLLDAAPDPSRRRRTEEAGTRATDGAVASSGCGFHPRCPHATEQCRSEVPPERDLPGAAGEAGHLARCFVLPPPEPAVAGAPPTARARQRKEPIP